MRVKWRPEARESARRFMKDQAGMRALVAAADALAYDPAPRGAFIRGEYRRLRVGEYRVLYRVQRDEVIIVRVDRVTPPGGPGSR